VPLREAPVERKRAYYQDLGPGALYAVGKDSNSNKGHKDPADWVPPNNLFRCTYVRNWIAVKKRWGLSMDGREVNAVAVVLRSCPP